MWFFDSKKGQYIEIHYPFLFSFKERLINCQPPRWYYHLSYNITPRTYLDAVFRQKLQAVNRKFQEVSENYARRRINTPHRDIKRRTTT